MTSDASPGALAAKAEALMAAGDTDAAILALKHTLKANPQDYTRWLQLARWLFAAGRYREAVKITQAAERFDPCSADFQAVQRHIQSRAFDDAGKTAAAMMDRIPHHPRAVFTLAHLARARGDAEASVSILQTGIDHSPANLILRNLLTEALEEAGAFAAAVDAARETARIEPSFQSLMTLATYLLRYGLNEELLETCDRAEALTGGSRLRQSDIDLIRAQALRIIGKREESVAAFRSCLAKNPGNANACWGLADLKTHAFSASDRQASEAILADPQSDAHQKCLAAFALAKASEADCDWDTTMALYSRANAAHPATGFDPGQFDAAVGRIVSSFTSQALAARADPATRQPVPIFIIGLPRSGSTLLEQILASHSAIEGTMEQPVLPSIKRKAHRLCAAQFSTDYLDAIGRISAGDLGRLGQAYLDEGALFRTGATPFFTDKLPFNFEHVSLIHKILPQAIIIDIRRNPLDCGFSLFRQYFSQGSPFSYDLGHIGRYYNGYLWLMDHWDAVLPGKVLHVQYEELVDDPEGQIRQILSHVGVPFERGCLDFHEIQRAVRTASSEQVRQPMNRAGIGAWRKVEAHLKPLTDSLGEATLRRFEAFI